MGMWRAFFGIRHVSTKYEGLVAVNTSIIWPPHPHTLSKLRIPHALLPHRSYPTTSSASPHAIRPLPPLGHPGEPAARGPWRTFLAGLHPPLPVPASAYYPGVLTLALMAQRLLRAKRERLQLVCCDDGKRRDQM